MRKAIFNNMSEHWMHCAKWNKSDGEKSLLYDLIFGIWKQDKNKLIGKKIRLLLAEAEGVLGEIGRRWLKRTNIQLRDK